MTLQLRGVSIALRGEPLIEPFDLEVGAGDVVTLMGPSGCGKSSLLAYLAGDLPAPLSGRGEIRLDGRILNDIPPERRRLGRLFQDDLLFPHMTVRENLLFGVPRGVAKHRQAAVTKALDDAELAGFGPRAPHTLSGGQRTRVALFRALLAEPHAILLDEPFARLDQDLRAAMREIVFARLRERAIPTLLVTHDRADAPTGHRVLKIANRTVVDA